jgi:hypothetical protein
MIMSTGVVVWPRVRACALEKVVGAPERGSDIGPAGWILLKGEGDPAGLRHATPRSTPEAGGANAHSVRETSQNAPKPFRSVLTLPS